MPPSAPPLLSRVLFAQDTYIVPKADGRIVVGATVEAGSFDPSVTPGGLMHCMANAVQLVPALADLPVEETWAGLRPTTPDKGPILGETPWSNVYLAGGYWRNGVLLAPKTGQLVGDLIAGTLSDESDRTLLGAFSWDRFTEAGGGDRMAANARYAASMHPVHGRSKGTGVSAAVGTELGFYSGAGAAAEERARDRAALFGGGEGGAGGTGGGEEDAFERAAMMGKTDASAFSFGGGFGDGTAAKEAPTREAAPPAEAPPTEAGGAPEAAAAGNGAEDATEEGGDLVLQNLYAQYRSRIDAIKDEAAQHGDLVPSERIPNVQDFKLEEERAYMEAFTHPEMLDEMAAEEERRKVYPADVLKPPGLESIPTPEEGPSGGDYDETTYDGYQAILKDDWGATEAELKGKMRRARIQNRGKVSEIDESKIGAVSAPGGLDDLEDVPSAETDSAAPEAPSFVASTTSTDLSSVYETIKANKAAATSQGVEMEEAAPDERPDPGFRIYRVDPETRESFEIPPYTQPGAVDEMIAEAKKKGEKQTVQPAASSSDASAPSGVNDNLSPLGPSTVCGAVETGEVPPDSRSDDEYNEETYDGYQAILKDDWGASEEDLKEKMRRSRIQNRGKVSEIGEFAIGAASAPDDPNESKAASTPEPKVAGTEGKEVTTETVLKIEQPDLSSIYEKIISNKAAVSDNLEMEESAPDDRPDPGFRIYRVDPETRESFEIPPYTQPGAVEEMIAEAKKQKDGGGPGVLNRTSDYFS